MTSGGVVVLLVLLGVVALSVTTLVLAVRGGRGPADPPASRLRTDPSGFPVLSAPRGALHRGPDRARPARVVPRRRPAVRGARRASPAR
ncbi:hypothetical protein [Geodermatophilus sp. CPCC 206100]|uniref:hypothetical protein n=1 Tax=Geodermatophilus sp. CPCC 206100 TaxID=3020054 RepID=UPI003AFF91BA